MEPEMGKRIVSKDDRSELEGEHILTKIGLYLLRFFYPLIEFVVTYRWCFIISALILMGFGIYGLVALQTHLIYYWFILALDLLILIGMAGGYILMMYLVFGR